MLIENGKMGCDNDFLRRNGPIRCQNPIPQKGNRFGMLEYSQPLCDMRRQLEWMKLCLIGYTNGTGNRERKGQSCLPTGRNL